PRAAAAGTGGGDGRAASALGASAAHRDVADRRPRPARPRAVGEPLAAPEARSGAVPDAAVIAPADHRPAGPPRSAAVDVDVAIDGDVSAHVAGSGAADARAGRGGTGATAPATGTGGGRRRAPGA